MAYTLADLQALDAAIANGNRSVKYGDKEVEFRSIGELMRARSFVAGELRKAGILTSGGQTSTTSFASFSRE